MFSLAFDPEETTHCEQVRHRQIGPEQWRKFETYAAEIFQAFGMNLTTPGTHNTPTRYLRALFDATASVPAIQRMIENQFQHRQPWLIGARILP